MFIRFKLFLFSDREACAIPDTENEEVIITGGMDNRRLVSVYSEAGWQRDLASLNQGRKLHACGNYINGGKKVIIITYTSLRMKI